LLALLAASNETGAHQPWREAIDWGLQHGVPVLIDATQWLGREPAGGLGQADWVIGSFHKLGGPKGVGFLKRPRTPHPFRGQSGGFQEADARSGTLNTAGILSAVAALEAACERAPLGPTARDRFEQALATSHPRIQFLATETPRLANTSAFLLPPEQESIRLVNRLETAGFLVSTGAACATGKAAPSPALDALGHPREAHRRLVRVSAGPDTSAADWRDLGAAIQATIESLQPETGDVVTIEPAP
jgi:cysteine desulfurase